MPDKKGSVALDFGRLATGYGMGAFSYVVPNSCVFNKFILFNVTFLWYKIDYKISTNNFDEIP